MLGNFGWLCLALFSLGGQLWAVPRASEELSAWAPAHSGDARLHLESLTRRRPLQQALSRRLGAQTEGNPSKMGLGLRSFSPREYAKEVPRGSYLLQRRLWESTRKQHKKRGNLSECFWKYCV